MNVCPAFWFDTYAKANGADGVTDLEIAIGCNAFIITDPDESSYILRVNLIKDKAVKGSHLMEEKKGNGTWSRI